MIRNAELGDFYAVLPLFHRAHMQSCYADTPSDETHMFRVWSAAVSQDGVFSKVVEHKGVIEGVMVGGISVNQWGATVASDMVVYSERDTDKLLRGFVRWAKSRGADAVSLSLIVDNPRFGFLIERLGFDSSGATYMRKV